MAEKITLYSDLTGVVDTPNDPVRPHLFEWEGVSKRIDLADSEYERWRDTIKPWLDVAQDAPVNKTRTVGKRGGDRDTEGARAKAWARTHGADMGGGRCPEDVLKAFRQDDPALIADRVNGTAPAQ